MINSYCSILDDVTDPITLLSLVQNVLISECYNEATTMDPKSIYIVYVKHNIITRTKFQCKIFLS